MRGRRGDFNRAVALALAKIACEVSQARLNEKISRKDIMYWKQQNELRESKLK